MTPEETTRMRDRIAEAVFLADIVEVPGTPDDDAAFAYAKADAFLAARGQGEGETNADLVLAKYWETKAEKEALTEKVEALEAEVAAAKERTRALEGLLNTANADRLHWKAEARSASRSVDILEAEVKERAAASTAAKNRSASDYAQMKRERDEARAEVKRVRGERDKSYAERREAAQTLIFVIGANGPETIVETTQRAARELTDRDNSSERVAELEELNEAQAENIGRLQGHFKKVTEGAQEENDKLKKSNDWLSNKLDSIASMATDIQT